MTEVSPCWDVDPRWPRFCAALANGRKRCRKGTCFLTDQAPIAEAHIAKQRGL